MGHNGAVPRTYTKHFSKTGPNHPRLEAASLAWLAQAEVSGGVRIAKVLEVSDTTLTLDYLPNGTPAPGAAEALGRALALTHAAGASHFGAPPPDWSGPGSIGMAPLSFVNIAPPQDPWGAFYYRERLAPYVVLANQRHALPADGTAVFAALGERLMAGQFDSPQPALTSPVARIHGDLWAGNLLFGPPSDQAGWTGAVLIDPATHGGHAETDLAMLALFGAPQLARILAAYHEASPLADGWPDRVALHQLHPVLVHAYLFGGGYGGQAVSLAKRYL